MGKITVLDQNTIDKIAAGEVIERPASVVKELIENSIDAGATAITVEIKEGGINFIRITDNGSGIRKEEVPLAFLRHSTSKIQSVEDLISVKSLGFRGEALSSIAAVSQVELITKTAADFTGIRYIIEGGTEKSLEEIGAPEGTTFLIRNLFYNTPVRRKFLKAAATEAGYVSDLIGHLSLSRPDISFKFILNNQTKLHTSGNTNLKDIIYHIYGREIAGNLLPVYGETEHIKIEGFIGKPVIARGNRNYENYYINGRYIKSKIVTGAIEEAYKAFMMQHRYPFTVLHLTIDNQYLDVNVHPTKMELRFLNQPEVYQNICETLKEALEHKELIPEIELSDKKNTEEQVKKVPYSVPEPFEKVRREQFLKEQAAYQKEEINEKINAANNIENNTNNKQIPQEVRAQKNIPAAGEQMELFQDRLLSSEARPQHHFIGQIFDTYWLVQYKDKLFIIDQHAAHEKVLYERMLKSLEIKEHTSQILNPPIILSLSMHEEELVHKYLGEFTKIGFEIEPFGGKEYAVRAVPGNLFSIAKKDLLIEMIDHLSETLGAGNPTSILEKIASMSCKAAVKGNNKLSLAEAQALIDELLTLENPYHCPHGRPTIISMSNYELDKKFKRIV